jgi:hypothetical protein
MRKKMRGSVKSRITDEQIEALTKKYSTKESVFDLLYTGPVNTPIRLTELLQKGVSLNSLAYGTSYFSPINLPEYKNGGLPTGTVTSWINQMEIVKTILANFINNNSAYFRKVSKTKYAITDEFILDILFYNKKKGFDAVDLSSISPYIKNLDIFNKIAETFYLPNSKNETLETLIRRHFNKCKPYKFTKKDSQGVALEGQK